MNLIKWDPFRELEDVSNRLNRIFGQPPARTGPDNEMLAVADWAPSVDISEMDSAYLIKGEIPGVKKEDVKVTVQDGMLRQSIKQRSIYHESRSHFRRFPPNQAPRRHLQGVCA